MQSYISFLLKSQNQHGIHSPFVYDLVTQCFYDRQKYPSYKILKEYRKSLLNNKNTIQITDFGAGSRVFKTSEREISAMARNVGITPKRARFLNRLVNYLKCRSALELGTSLGIGTAAIAAENRVQVTSIEGCPETAKIAKQQFEKFGLKNIELKTGEFTQVLDSLRKREETGEERKDKIQELRHHKPEKPNTEILKPRTENPQQKYDLIYFDGNHQKQATLDYFEMLLPTAHNDSVFIFDDIHWSAEMEEAWEQIKDHPSVSVSIDTFFWGLVFFRREQAKQHFKIRL